MSAHPYRVPAPRAPEAPKPDAEPQRPLALRAVEWALFAAENFLASFRCLRRRAGGRWAMVRSPWNLTLDARGLPTRALWVPFDKCPASLPYGDYTEADLLLIKRASTREVFRCLGRLVREHREKCSCEVWP